MKIETAASIEINASQEKVWKFISDLRNVPSFLKRWGPIPGVKNVEITSGHKEMAVGLTQTTTTTDGNILYEAIKTVRKPEYFDYQIEGFSFPFSLLTKKGGGSWTLFGENNKTRVTWRYYFNLSSPFIYPAALPLVKVFYKKALSDAVKRLKQNLEFRN